MPDTQPACPALTADLWREIVLAARRRLTPLTLRDTSASAGYQEWQDWWQLVVCIASTCGFLSETLLGPDAAALWRDSFLESSAHQGVQRRLLRQAHHAHRAVLVGRDWDAGELQAAVARLTSVQELCMFVSLPAWASPLHSLCFLGQALLQQLRHLRLEMSHLSEADVHYLADWVPRLHRLELQLDIELEAELPFPVCPFRHLSLIHTAELVLELRLAFGASLQRRLRQLAGVALHTLVICTSRPLYWEEEELLARCHVTDRVLLRGPTPVGPGWQLQRLPSGAAVVCETDS